MNTDIVRIDNILDARYTFSSACAMRSLTVATALSQNISLMFECLLLMQTKSTENIAYSSKTEIEKIYILLRLTSRYMHGDLKHNCYIATFFFVEVCKHTSGQILKHLMEQVTKKILQIFSFVHSHSFAFAACVYSTAKPHVSSTACVNLS